MAQVSSLMHLHEEPRRLPKNPPPSREEAEAFGRDRYDITQKLEERLHEVSEILELICAVRKPHLAGHGLAAASETEREDEDSVDAPSQPSRQHLAELACLSVPQAQAVRTRQMSETPFRPRGLRRPHKSEARSELELQGVSHCQDEGDEGSSLSILGSTDKRQRQAPRSPLASLAVEPMTRTPLSEAEMDDSGCMEDGWKWNDSRRCSSSLDRLPETTPPATSRSRKSSLLNRLNRSPAPPRPSVIKLGPIEQPFSAGAVSPVQSEPRSKMEWDSSDDEDESLAGKFRKSLGKGSFKAPKLRGFLRRNSSD